MGRSYLHWLWTGATNSIAMRASPSRSGDWRHRPKAGNDSPSEDHPTKSLRYAPRFRWGPGVKYDDLSVRIFPDIAALAADAADEAAATITSAIAEGGHANVMLATGNSQLAFLDELITRPLDWA